MVDDDGSLTVGTVVNNAWKQELYDQIDAALTTAGGAIVEVTTTAVGTQADLVLGTTAANVLLRCNNASLLTITGITAQAGQRVVIVSVGAGQVECAHQSTGSTAANRLINCATSGTTPLAAGSGAATYVYDDTTDRWRLVKHTQGAGITRAFNAGDYSGAGTMTVTAEASDVVSFAYLLNGRMLTVFFYLDSLTIGGTPTGGVQITIPNGFVGARLVAGVTRYINAGALGFGRTFVNPASTFITVEIATQGAWVAGTHNTSIQGQITCEVT